MYKLISSHTQRQQGISLIESLVAIVVTALGILGILGVQMRTLADTSTTVRRAQAIRLIEDLSERMKINPNAMVTADAYKADFTTTPTFTKTACDSGCDAKALAEFDLAKWKTTVAQTLPLGQASIFWALGEGSTAKDPNRRQLGVMISWRENEREGTKTDAIDATKGNASGGAGSAATCPDGRVCHLQYIPVSARCAPYDNGSGTPSFYCS